MVEPNREIRGAYQIKKMKHKKIQTERKCYPNSLGSRENVGEDGEVWTTIRKKIAFYGKTGWTGERFILIGGN